MAWYHWIIPAVGLHKWFWDKLRPERPGMPGRIPHSAAYGVALPLIYGKTRVTGNLIYFEPASINGGRNVGARVLIALCEGPITGISRIWRDSDVRTVAEWGFVVKTGTRPTQTAWDQLPAGKDLGYPGVAMIHPPYIISEWGLGWIGQASYEVQGLLHATGDATNGDAHPADILKGSVATPASSMLCHPEYGAGFPYTVEIELGRDGLAASSFRRNATAEGFWISPAFTEQKPATQHLQEVLDASNATCLWTSGLLEIVPLGDQSVTGNSVTYTPANAIQYALTKDDFLARDDGSRIEIALAPETDTFNVAPIEFLDRAPAAATADPAHAYNVAVEEDPDPVDVFSVRGERRASVVQLHAICQRSIALKISRIRAQRMMGARNLYKFTLPWRFCRLQPLDFVTLTDDLLGLAAVPVRIESVKEDPETRELEIEALDWPAGTSSAVAHDTSSSDAPGPGISTYQTETRLREVAAQSWSQRTGLPAEVSKVASSGTRLVAVGVNAAMYSDDHGETWIVGSIPAGTWNHIQWIPWLSLWVAVGASVAASSTDGITFTTRTIPAGTYNGLVDTGSAIGAVGASVAAYSTTGTSWTAATGLPAGTFYAAAWSGTAVAAVGNGVAATTTASCQVWTSRTAATGTYTALAWGDLAAKFVAVGSPGAGSSMTVATALADGVTWTKQTTGFSGSSVDFPHHGLTADGFIFVGSTGNGTIWMTRDGLEWKYARPTSVILFGITWTGKRYVAAGFVTRVWISAIVA